MNLTKSITRTLGDKCPNCGSRKTILFDKTLKIKGNNPIFKCKKCGNRWEE